MSQYTCPQLDSLSANLRLPGLLVLEPVVAPLRDVSGTLASLVVPSAGFVNSKLVLSLAIPELTLCFSPRGFGAMMKFGANPDPTQVRLHHPVSSHSLPPHPSS